MERERFIHLVQAEQVSLRRYLLGLCRGNAVEADDIFQEAMMRAYLASPSFLERVRPGAWLLKICYHCFIDRMRSRNRQDQDDLETASCLSNNNSADESFRYEALWLAVCHLPDKERSCIMLFYKEDMSIKDIAAVMGIPTGSVKAYLFRARKKLRIVLQNETH